MCQNLKMSKKQSQIKPQDVVILLKLLLCNPNQSRMVDLASDLEISLSEVSQGINRLRSAQLIEKDGRSPLRDNVYEFIIHAIKYIFPAKLDKVARGIPTAHSAPPLSKAIKSSKEDQYVWPYDKGEMRGQSLIPLYPSVPKAALKDLELHKLLALIDSIRIGRVREQNLAIKEFKKYVS